MEAAEIDIEVVYVGAPPAVRALRVAATASVLDAISHSGLAEMARLDLRRCGVGIFGRRVSLGDGLHAGDRVEIYEPLRADPKARRRARARNARRQSRFLP
ncbi:MAG: RnfH family protein [Gammaproteobacteria bacterium]|nr:RnfH family protein [Gammaproteobacteria bacterium]